MRLHKKHRRGFTLAEVAVTIALVGIALAWLLQALSAAKITAANARNIKLARELALLTMGQIESGLFEKEIDDDRIEGSYADEGYPDFSFEAVLGDENFKPDSNDAAAFDNWRHDQDRKKAKEDSSSSKDDDKETEQPYEKIQIKVTFPKTRVDDTKNDFVIEKWIAWKQLHPDEPDDANSANNAANNAANSNTANSPSSSKSGSTSNTGSRK